MSEENENPVTPEDIIASFDQLGAIAAAFAEGVLAPYYQALLNTDFPDEVIIELLIAAQKPIFPDFTPTS